MKMPRRVPFVHLNNSKSKFVLLLPFHSSFIISIVFSGIDQLPDYLDEVLRKIEAFTGLSATIMVGGPIPAAGGAISTTR